jgi:hypothetical protein
MRTFGVVKNGFKNSAAAVEDSRGAARELILLKLWVAARFQFRRALIRHKLRP